MGRKRGVQYRPGSWWRADDRSGFTRRAEDTRQEWNKLTVGKDLWEARQPQDFVVGVADNQAVPDARPQPPAAFSGPISTTLSANVAIGATFVPLSAINGFSAGGQLGVMMDDGEYFNTTQVGAATSNGITIAAPIPGPASSGNVVTAYLPSPGVFP